MPICPVAFDRPFSLPPPPPFSSSVHNFNIFMKPQHLQPLSAHKRLLFSSKAGNKTNIVFHKSLEAWSSPLLSDIGSQRSFQGLLIKEHVWLSISLTAAHAEQRHTDYTCHSGLTCNPLIPGKKTIVPSLPK